MISHLRLCDLPELALTEENPQVAMETGRITFFFFIHFSFAFCGHSSQLGFCFYDNGRNVFGIAARSRLDDRRLVPHHWKFSSRDILGYYPERLLAREKSRWDPGSRLHSSLLLLYFSPRVLLPRRSKSPRLGRRSVQPRPLRHLKTTATP